MTDITIEQLQAELAAAQSEKEALAAKAQQVLDEKKKLAARYEGVDLDSLKARAELASKFEGVDPEQIERLREMQKAAADEKEKQILSEKGPEGWLEHRMAAEREASAVKLKAEAKAREELAAKVSDYERKEEARKFDRQVKLGIHESGRFQDGLEDVISIYANQFAKRSEDGDVRFVVEGETFYSPEDGTKPATVAEFIKHKIPELKPGLLRQPKGSGANGSGENHHDFNPYMGGARKHLAEQAALLKSNPERAERLKKAAIAAGKYPKI